MRKSTIVHVAIGVFASLMCLSILTSEAVAQSTITGAVKDESGAVLPGVTIEATSPALIERTRTVITDEGGKYRIIDLPPERYTRTFALPGFMTFHGDQVSLPPN